MEPTHLQRAQACLTHNDVKKVIDPAQIIQLAQAHAWIDLAQTARAILAELQPQRLEPRVEHACVALDPDLAAALGICPLCQERKIVRDGRCAQCAGQEYIPEAQRPATVTGGEWDPAVVAAGEGE